MAAADAPKPHSIASCHPHPSFRLPAHAPHRHHSPAPPPHQLLHPSPPTHTPAIEIPEDCPDAPNVTCKAANGTCPTPGIVVPLAGFCSADRGFSIQYVVSAINVDNFTCPPAGKFVRVLARPVLDVQPWCLFRAGLAFRTDGAWAWGEGGAECAGRRAGGDEACVRARGLACVPLERCAARRTRTWRKLLLGRGRETPSLERPHTRPCRPQGRRRSPARPRPASRAPASRTAPRLAPQCSSAIHARPTSRM